jgi:hypothetical protein
MNRRHVLALLAASALPAGCAPAKLPDPIAAWRRPGAGEADPRRYALAHALLAPNPHNRQPWLAELVGEDEIVLSPDTERLLPQTDPYNRQITIGCGAFLELLALAAAERGFTAEITPFPEGEPAPTLDARPFARVRFVQGGQRDPLFAQIAARRTNRLPYQDRAVPPEAFAQLTGAARAPDLLYGRATTGAERDALRDLLWRAFDREAHTPHAHHETARLLRVGRAMIALHRDGIAVTGAFVEAVAALNLVTFDMLADPDHPFTKPSLDGWRPLAEAAPALFWIASVGNARVTQITVGRAYARVNLKAAQLGLAIHPWSQALQEYPEMADLKDEVTRATKTNGATLQMLVRVGYPIGTPAPAPRRGLAEHIRA